MNDNNFNIGWPIPLVAEGSPQNKDLEYQFGEKVYVVLSPLQVSDPDNGNKYYISDISANRYYSFPVKKDKLVVLEAIFLRDYNEEEIVEIATRKTEDCLQYSFLRETFSVKYNCETTCIEAKYCFKRREDAELFVEMEKS